METIKEKLQHFGFSDYDSRAYEVLLKYGILSATEISEKSKIPQGRIYSVLKSLENGGYCSIYPGPIKKYKATDPERALSKIIDTQKQQVANSEKLKKDLLTVYKEADISVTPLDFIEILTSKPSHITRFDDIVNRTTKTLYSFNKRPYATGFMRDKAEIIKASEPLRRIIDKGVSIRAIFEQEPEHTDKFITMVSYYESIGEEVRICEKLPLKMLLSDSECALIALRNQNEDKDKFSVTSMVIDHSDLTIALSELFENYWKTGITIKDYLKIHQILKTI